MEANGFRIEHKNGSLAKIYPKETNKKFYSLHLSSDGGLFPMRRFFKKELGLDILSL